MVHDSFTKGPSVANVALYIWTCDSSYYQVILLSYMHVCTILLSSRAGESLR